MEEGQDVDYDFDAAIRKVPDFPKPGILFYDITGLLINPEAFQAVTDKMLELFQGQGYEAVAAIESRGFIFAAPYAQEAQLPLILIRKKGKLPGKVLSKSFALEYGEDVIEVQEDDVPKGKKVLLIDDLLATGGTLSAARDLLVQGGAIVDQVFSVVGLPFLHPEKKLQGVKITTILDYHSE
jgi:adenine phosphoribosyltransferase